MAVNVVNQPNSLVSVSPNLFYQFEQTVGAAAGKKLYFFSRVNFNGGFLKTKRDLVEYSGNNIPLDVSELIEPLLDNPIKGINDNLTLISSDFTGSLYIEYGEIEIDLNDQSQNVLSVETTPTITVKWGSFRYYDDDLIELPSQAQAVVHNDKPDFFTIYRDGLDWFYFGGNSGSAAGLNISAYNSGGTLLERRGLQANAGVTLAVPIGGANFESSFTFDINQASRIVFDVGIINGGSVDVGFTLVNSKRMVAKVVSCKNDFAESEVYFRELKGGWSSFRFDEIQIIPIVNRSVFTSYSPSNGSKILRSKNGGSRMYNINGRTRCRLSKKIKILSSRYRRYLEALCNCTDVFVRVESNDGDYIQVKGVLVEANNPIGLVGEYVTFSVVVDLFKDY
jgi:hypothetical protein